MIEIQINQKNIRGLDRLFVNLGKYIQKPTESLKQIGITMLASVDKNFDTEGRPERWAPLSPMTLAMRRNKNSSSAKILQDTGNLRRSINYALVGDDTGVAVGTNVKYAPKHQFGATERIPARTIVPKRAKALRFTINGKVVYATKVHQKARTVTIPKRPFLLFQEEDIQDIRQILLEGLMGVTNENSTE